MDKQNRLQLRALQGSLYNPIATLIKCDYLRNLTARGEPLQVRIKEFRGGGGGGRGAEGYLPARTLRARNRTHFRHGSRARFKRPGSSRVVLMLSRAILTLFLSILIEIWIKNIVDPISRARLCAPLPQIRHCSCVLTTTWGHVIVPWSIILTPSIWVSLDVVALWADELTCHARRNISTGQTVCNIRNLQTYW